MTSAFVSLTLTPVLNVFLGGSASHHSKFYVKSEPFFAGMEKGYRKFLCFFLQNKWVAFAILGFCVVLILSLSKALKSELAPLEDHSYLRTSITAPEGTEYLYNQKLIDKVAQISMLNPNCCQLGNFEIWKIVWAQSEIFECSIVNRCQSVFMT